MQEISKIHIRTPDDLISVVPYMVGFQPTSSLVFLAGASGVRLQMIGCIDLPENSGDFDEIADAVVLASGKGGDEFVLMVGYGPGNRVTPVVCAVAARLRETRVRVKDAFRVHEGRYWSYLCDAPDCCPPEGTPVADKSSVVAATAVAAGLSAPTHEELAATVSPCDGATRERMRAATRDAERRRSGRSRREIRRDGVRAVHEAIDRTLNNGHVPDIDADDVAWLGACLRDKRVRDEAWARTHTAGDRRLIELWTYLLRHMEPNYVPAVGALAAAAAWVCGQSALARLALDRVEEVDPDYALGTLLRRALNLGIPPRDLKVTPEDLPPL